VVVASAGSYASLHLATDRQPRRHPTTQIFTGRMPFLPPNQQRQSTEGTFVENHVFQRTHYSGTTGYFRLLETSHGEPPPSSQILAPPHPHFSRRCHRLPLLMLLLLLLLMACAPSRHRLRLASATDLPGTAESVDFTEEVLQW